ncbi:MAG: DNA mismatch repair protein [Halobacteria archaeon]
MSLDDYWGVGPKTRELLEENLGDSVAEEAIESADISKLTDSGLARGRATRIVRQAKGGAGLDVLATSDARKVYKQLLDLVSGYAVTPGARDRISVLTPMVSRTDIEESLTDVLEMRYVWSELSGETREKITGIFERYGEAGEGRKAAVDVALEAMDLNLDRGRFSELREFDREVLESTREALAFLEGDRVDEGADQELDRLREMNSRVSDLEENSLDIVENLRGSGVQDVDALQDEFVDHVVGEADVPYGDVQEAVPENPLDVTDFVTDTLRTLSRNVEESMEEREEAVREELAEDLEDHEGSVDEVSEVVDDLALLVSLARFAGDLNLTEPEFVEDGVGFVGGRNLGIEKGSVQPVQFAIGSPGFKEDENSDVDFPEEDLVSVLTGANSGGKTTLLETTCQIVLLAQMGLPVPAEKAHVSLFDSLVFHRRHASFNAGVLESTLRSVVPPLTLEGDTLMLVDEFEAITEPGSAADLLHGLVNLTVDSGAHGVFVTHLADDLEPLPEEARVDGIFAEGLDDELELDVDYQPRFDTIGKSTPEFIVSRLIAGADDQQEKIGFERLGKSVGEQEVQQTLSDI